MRCSLLLFHDAFVTAFVTLFVFPQNSSILVEVEFEYLKKVEGVLIVFDVITRKHHKKKSHVFFALWGHLSQLVMRQSKSQEKITDSQTFFYPMGRLLEGDHTKKNRVKS